MPPSRPADRRAWRAGRHRSAPPAASELFPGLPLTPAVRDRLAVLDEHCRRGVLQLLADDHYDGITSSEAEILTLIDEVARRLG
jgi:hypothetical protein